MDLRSKRYLYYKGLHAIRNNADNNILHLNVDNHLSDLLVLYIHQIHLCILLSFLCTRDPHHLDHDLHIDLFHNRLVDLMVLAPVWVYFLLRVMYPFSLIHCASFESLDAFSQRNDLLVGDRCQDGTNKLRRHHILVALIGIRLGRHSSSILSNM